MFSKNGNKEKRQYPRVKMGKAVVFRNGQYLSRYTVENLSAGGACLIGETPIKRGEQVEVALSLDDRTTLCIQSVGVHCCCISANDMRIGVSFRHESSDAEDIIQDAVLAEIERNAHPGVIVVDDSIEVCHALERDLRALGHYSYFASNFSSTVKWLENPDIQIDAALVDLFLGKIDGLAILKYLAIEHPGIHRVLMSGVARPYQLDLARSTNRANAILEKPWNRKRLADALGCKTSLKLRLCKD